MRLFVRDILQNTIRIDAHDRTSSVWRPPQFSETLMLTYMSIVRKREKHSRMIVSFVYYFRGIRVVTFIEFLQIIFDDTIDLLKAIS